MTPSEEFDLWAESARSVDRLLGSWADLQPAEALVVDAYNPAPDLQRRAMSWSHEFLSGELPELLAFGAGLVAAGRDAAEGGFPDVAARALSDRRFLLGDRILHWAVPWLDAVGSVGEEALGVLLLLGDHHRPAPELSGNEGLTAPGQDLFGEHAQAPLSSLLCGAVVLEFTAARWGCTRAQLRAGAFPPAAAAWLAERAERWEGLRQRHPGSAALWRDLAKRASASSIRG